MLTSKLQLTVVEQVPGTLTRRERKFRGRRDELVRNYYQLPLLTSTTVVLLLLATTATDATTTTTTDTSRLLGILSKNLRDEVPRMLRHVLEATAIVE